MVETRARRGKRKKENPLSSEKKENSAKKAKSGAEKIVKVKFVRSVSSTALEKTTTEMPETMALKETTTRTALEKTSDVSEATIEATNSSGMRKSDHIEAGPAALENSATSDKEDEGEESEEEVGEKGVANNVEESGDASGNADDGDGELREDNTNKEDPKPANRGGKR
ncbi:hypothetical protein Bca52824_010637 [Brassica carinata]|uniref:Uncharacterized protein n=1 Tax=Brassica carinata TaxID=52824 RepID=A0A8X8B7U6_BRACI|nr:hypothetical protein Bca52824_010637 [Brassica carinata]